MKRSLSIFIATLAILLLAIGAWVFLSRPDSTKTKPTTAATPQAPPQAQTPTTDKDWANSLAFPTTVVSINDQSITFLMENAPVTLPIDRWTSVVGVSSIKDIKPNAKIGIRLTADKKRILVLNGTWM